MTSMGMIVVIVIILSAFGMRDGVRRQDASGTIAWSALFIALVMIACTLALLHKL